MTVAQVQESFPQLEVKDLNGGCNVYLPTGMSITFWFKKRKFKSNTGSTWGYFKDITDIVKIIEGACQPKSRKTFVVTPTPEDDKGTQKCIDHILAKASRVEKIKGESNAIYNILKTVAQELEQFL